MCGILFYRDPAAPPERARLERALAAMRARGPDRQDLWLGGDVALGHARLSIIDLSEAAAQPFRDRSGRFLLTYNGEIYNYAEIGRALAADGIALRTRSDTEVLLEGLLHFGVGPMLARTRGMFAFVLYDTLTGRVTAARDHFGQKPLYWQARGGRLAIASDLRALLALADGAEPDLAAYSVYLSAGGSDGTRGQFRPDGTFFAGVAALPAGCLLVAEAGRVEVSEYFAPWELFDAAALERNRARAEDELVEELGGLFAQSARRHVVSDVPVGVLLSGGIDSSLVFWTAQPLLRRLTTFTKLSPGIEEIPLAAVPELLKRRPASAWFGLQRPTDYLPGLVRFIAASGAPSRWGSGPPMASLCADARRNGVPVLLGGDCGDECFGGYGHYERAFAAPDPDPFALGDLVGLNPDSPFYRPEAAEPYEARERRVRRRIVDALAGVADPREKAAFALLLHDAATFLQACVLPHSDAYSMMESVELRTPLLDLDLVRFAVNLPLAQRASRHPSGHFGKALVRTLADREIGPFLNLRKEGTRNYAMAVARPDYWRFDRFEIGRLFPIPAELSRRDVIRLMNLEIFHRLFFLGEPDPLPDLLSADGLRATAGAEAAP